MSEVPAHEDVAIADHSESHVQGVGSASRPNDVMFQVGFRQSIGIVVIGQGESVFPRYLYEAFSDSFWSPSQLADCVFGEDHYVLTFNEKLPQCKAVLSKLSIFASADN